MALVTYNQCNIQFLELDYGKRCLVVSDNVLLVLYIRELGYVFQEVMHDQFDIYVSRDDPVESSYSHASDVLLLS